MQLACSFLLFALFSLCQGTIMNPFPQYRRFPRPNVGQMLDQQYTTSTHWYNTKLDHFSPTNTRTFRLKYLVNTDNYEEGGPMFFYNGNEGPIELFVEATGIMWDLAKQFKAALVFGEHRYYGESQPFDTYENAFTSINNLAYFSSEQALADYAALITDLKSDSNATGFHFSSETKVLAFGGSYGGLLSAWFRKKYPHVIAGAWASSAPVLYFNGGGVDYGAFEKVITDTFRKSGCDVEAIAKSWDAIRNVAKTDDGRALLNDIFNVADSSKLTGKANEAEGLIGYLYQAYVWLATTDYPYPTSFVSPMPGWPAKVSCQNVPVGGTFASDEDLTRAIASLTNVYFNWNNDTHYRACFDDTCGNPASTVMGTPLAWPFQECTEIFMPICYRGMPNDFFQKNCPDDGSSPVKNMRIYCGTQFTRIGWKPNMLDENAVPVEFGTNYDSASNLIITQGDLDPSSAGGLKEGDSERGLFVVTIKNAAHHLDFRTPNTCDPSNLASVRYQIVRILQCWLDPSECPSSYSLTDSESIIPPSDTECRDIIEGFPWGQKDSSEGQTTSSERPQTTTKGSTSYGLFSIAALFVVVMNL